MTVRRTLGSGPEAFAHSIRAAQADLLGALPGVQLPNLDELRSRGVLGAQPVTSRSPRRSLRAGGRAVEVPHPGDPDRFDWPGRTP